MVTAKAGMLIRRPVAKVFEAFVDPAITSRFWLTRGSGRLEPGKQVTWEWEMYGVSAHVSVKAIERNRRIHIEWPGTFVSITNTGFTGDAEAVAAQAVAGLKALLEHGVRLNLVADRFPKGMETHP
jgi:uncharacterized protein YndB with AHSA1/START domain